MSRKKTRAATPELSADGDLDFIVGTLYLSNGWSPGDREFLRRCVGKFDGYTKEEAARLRALQKGRLGRVVPAYRPPSKLMDGVADDD